MSETKFTPGPWEAEPDYFGDFTIKPEGATLAIAAVVNGEMNRMGGHHRRQEANARLIAAAPELYDAVRAIETARHSDDPKDWQRATELSDAALAKAEGRQP